MSAHQQPDHPPQAPRAPLRQQCVLKKSRVSLHIDPYSDALYFPGACELVFSGQTDAIVPKLPAFFLHAALLPDGGGQGIEILSCEVGVYQEKPRLADMAKEVILIRDQARRLEPAHRMALLRQTVAEDGRRHAILIKIPKETLKDAQRLNEVAAIREEGSIEFTVVIRYLVHCAGLRGGVVRPPVSGVAFTRGGPGACRLWMPCEDGGPSHQNLFELQITVPANLTCVASGELVSRANSSEVRGATCFTYALSTPSQAAKVGFVVAPFTRISPAPLPPPAQPAGAEQPPSGGSRQSAGRGNPSKRQRTGQPDPAKPAGTASQGPTIDLYHPPHLPLSHLRHTLSVAPACLAFMSAYLEVPCPFSTVNLCVVEGLDRPVTSLSGLVLLPAALVRPVSDLDNVVHARMCIARGFAELWFGVLLTAKAWEDYWVVQGLAGLLVLRFVRKALGYTEFHVLCDDETAELAHLENRSAHRAAVLAPLSRPGPPAMSAVEVLSEHHARKAPLVVAMLEAMVGPAFMRGYVKLLLQAASVPPDTDAFIAKMCEGGGDMIEFDGAPLKALWLHGVGLPEIQLGFNKSKIGGGAKAGSSSSSMRLALLQDARAAVFTGKLTVRVFEIGGAVFDHVLAIRGEMHLFDSIPLHDTVHNRSRLREIRDPLGKAVKVRVGKALPMNYIRPNPDQKVLAIVTLYQTETMLLNMLELDRDAVSQRLALRELLAEFTDRVDLDVAVSAIKSGKLFCAVRIEAALGLARSAARDGQGPRTLARAARELLIDLGGVPRPNRFADIAEYRVRKGIVAALGLCAGAEDEPRKVLFDLLRLNDNTGNPFLDYAWISVIVRALGVLRHPSPPLTTAPSSSTSTHSTATSSLSHSAAAEAPLAKVRKELHITLELEEMSDEGQAPGEGAVAAACLCALADLGSRNSDPDPEGHGAPFFTQRCRQGRTDGVRLAALYAALKTAARDDGPEGAVILHVLPVALSLLEDPLATDHFKARVCRLLATGEIDDPWKPAGALTRPSEAVLVKEWAPSTPLPYHHHPALSIQSGPGEILRSRFYRQAILAATECIPLFVEVFSAYLTLWKD